MVNQQDDIQNGVIECAICYDIIGNRNCCVTPCGHQFCFICIAKSLQNNSKCPYCRSQLREEVYVIEDDDSNEQEINREESDVENTEQYSQNDAQINDIDTLFDSDSDDDNIIDDDNNVNEENNEMMIQELEMTSDLELEANNSNITENNDSDDSDNSDNINDSDDDGDRDDKFYNKIFGDRKFINTGSYDDNGNYIYPLVIENLKQLHNAMTKCIPIGYTSLYKPLLMSQYNKYELISNIKRRYPTIKIHQLTSENIIEEHLKYIQEEEVAQNKLIDIYVRTRNIMNLDKHTIIS